MVTETSLGATADSSEPTRVLVVEDEHKVATALREGLEGEGYVVGVEESGESAFFRATHESFDLILLDLGLPGRDGLEIMTALRQGGDVTPIIILTARDAVVDRVAGLDGGADDYLAKPFAFTELLARVKAILRRGRASSTGPISIGGLTLDPGARHVQYDGREIPLTAKEFDLLEYLASSERQVVSRDALAREVWKESARSTTLDNVIDVHVSRLRRKLSQEGRPQLLHTVRGVGFVLRRNPV